MICPNSQSQAREGQSNSGLTEVTANSYGKTQPSAYLGNTLEHQTSAAAPLLHSDGEKEVQSVFGWSSSAKRAKSCGLEDSNSVLTPQEQRADRPETATQFLPQDHNGNRELISVTNSFS